MRLVPSCHHHLKEHRADLSLWEELASDAALKNGCVSKLGVVVLAFRFPFKPTRTRYPPKARQNDTMDHLVRRNFNSRCRPDAMSGLEVLLAETLESVSKQPQGTRESVQGQRWWCPLQSSQTSLYKMRRVPNELSHAGTPVRNLALHKLHQSVRRSQTKEVKPIPSALELEAPRSHSRPRLTSGEKSTCGNHGMPLPRGQPLHKSAGVLNMPVKTPFGLLSLRCDGT